MSPREIQRLERKVNNQQEVISTLIGWLAQELGPQNARTLLNMLNKEK